MQQALPLGLKTLETFSIKQTKVLRNYGANSLKERLEECAGGYDADDYPQCDKCIFIESCKNRWDKVNNRDIA